MSGGQSPDNDRDMTASVLLLCLAIQAPASGDLQARLSDVRTALNAGQVDRALDQLQQLPADDLWVRYLTGVAHYHRDDPARAIDALAPIAHQLPEGSVERKEAIQVLGLSYYLAGRLKEAVPLLEETRAWAADNIELAQVLGLAYVQTSQPDKAREALATTFGVAADSAAAHVFAAQMMIRIEFHEAAEAELKKALALDRKLPRTRFLLGEIAIYFARIDEGIEYFRKELELNPLDPMAHYRLGEAYARQQKWDPAIAALQRSLWINPYYSGPLIVLGRAYLAKTQAAVAEGFLRRATEYDPNNKSAHYLLGQALQKLGRTEEADKEFAIAAKLSDSSATR